MRRVNPAVLVLAGLGILAIVILAVFAGRGASPKADRLSDEQAFGSSPSSIDKRCGSQATYDRVKTELFRQAARVRKSDQDVFDRLSAYASVRVERPLMRSHDSDLGTIRCSGRLSLDLPPGVAVVGGRRMLSADIDYVLQPAADGSGDVVILEGADPIIIPLATLMRTGADAPDQAPPPPWAPGVVAAPAPAGPDANLPQPPSAAPAPERPVAPTAVTRPSFNCRYARTRAEIAVCQTPELAVLDRQMAGQYYRAIAAADRRQRATLIATRDSFLRFRDRCPDDSCIADAYRGRMSEIRDIMSGAWRPGR